MCARLVVLLRKTSSANQSQGAHHLARRAETALESAQVGQVSAQGGSLIDHALQRLDLIVSNTGRQDTRGHGTIADQNGAGSALTPFTSELHGRQAEMVPKEWTQQLVARRGIHDRAVDSHAPAFRTRTSRPPRFDRITAKTNEPP
jgi:hypothetical protein